MDQSLSVYSALRKKKYLVLSGLMSCLQIEELESQYELSHLLILLNQRRSELFDGTNLYEDLILGAGRGLVFKI